MTSLSQIEAEFDKEYLERPYEEGIVYADGKTIKQFYHSKITELLESTKLETRAINEATELEEAYRIKSGYNQAVSDQATKINEALK